MTYQQPRKNTLVAVLVIAGLLLAAGATAIIVLTSRDSGTSAQPAPTTTESPDAGLAAERDAAVEGGAQAARILNTLDHATVEEDLDRWESVVTGELLTQLRDGRTEAIDQVKAARSKTVATVLSAALAEYDPENGTARLLVVVRIVVDVDGTETVKRTRLSVPLEKTADGWKATAANAM